MQQLNDDDFDSKVLRSLRPAAVKFTAEWCPGCVAIRPVLAQLAAEYAGRVDFYEMDVDRNQRVAADLGIEVIPTTVFFRDGREVGRIVGGTRTKLEALFRAAG